MDIEKLKPWNWFKHEDNSNMQIPVSKNEVTISNPQDADMPTTPQSPAFGSLMQLHTEMDRLFNEVWRSFGMPSNSKITGPSARFESHLFNNFLPGDYQAKLDVSGDNREYEVSIDLPGLSEEDIQIDLRGNILTIKGHKEEKNESKDKQYYRIERSAGSFQRTLSLPEDADQNDISANIKNGLLVIRIPRKELANEDVKRISVSS